MLAAPRGRYGGSIRSSAAAPTTSGIAAAAASIATRIHAWFTHGARVTKASRNAANAGHTMPVIATNQTTDPKAMVVTMIWRCCGIRPNSSTVAHPSAVLATRPSDRSASPIKTWRMATSKLYPAPGRRRKRDRMRRRENASPRQRRGDPYTGRARRQACLRRDKRGGLAVAQDREKGDAVTRITRRGLLTGAAAAGAGLAAGTDRGAPGWLGETRDAGIAAAAPRRGGTLRIAEIGEPLTLDTVATTADLTSTITLPVFEELFIFDANWRIQPLLASSYSVSKDGLTYTITLRKNVPFHNGRDVTPADVVASLNRWGRVSPRGPSVYQNVDSVQPLADGVVIKLKRPYAPLLAFLALPNGAAAIMPREIV